MLAVLTFDKFIMHFGQRGAAFAALVVLALLGAATLDDNGASVQQTTADSETSEKIFI